MKKLYNNIPIVSENKEILQKYFEKSPWYGSTANDIDWISRVEVQSMIQRYTSHSISSTINLPNDVTTEEVNNIYLHSYVNGLKGVTVYRDGSRGGVLIKDNTNSQTFKENPAPKRPKVLKAEFHQTKVKGVNYVIIVGLLDNKPYEVFAFRVDNKLKIDQHIGTTTKVKKGRYIFDSDYINLEGLESSADTSEERAHSLMMSMLLRHGAPLKFIIKTAKKVDDNITSFSSAISRILSKYVEVETLEGACPECGGKLIKEEGCEKCTSCSYSRC